MKKIVFHSTMPYTCSIELCNTDTDFRLCIIGYLLWIQDHLVLLSLNPFFLRRTLWHNFRLQNFTLVLLFLILWQASISDSETATPAFSKMSHKFSSRFLLSTVLGNTRTSIHCLLEYCALTQHCLSV